NKGEVKLADTPEFQRRAKMMEAVRTNAVNAVEGTYDKQMGDLATGKTAIVHQGDWSYGLLTDYGDREIGLMPVPIAGTGERAVDPPAGWAVNNQASADQIEAANAFMNWLYTSETGKKIIVEDFKFTPAMANIEPEGLDPLSQAVFEAT